MLLPALGSWATSQGARSNCDSVVGEMSIRRSKKAVDRHDGCARVRQGYHEKKSTLRLLSEVWALGSAKGAFSRGIFTFYSTFSMVSKFMSIVHSWKTKSSIWNKHCTFPFIYFLCSFAVVLRHFSDLKSAMAGPRSHVTYWPTCGGNNSRHTSQLYHHAASSPRMWRQEEHSRTSWDLDGLLMACSNTGECSGGRL